MTLYRIYPVVRGAAPDEPGGALFTSTAGNGRIGNPDIYDELYFADAAEGAIAETFGRLTDWHGGMLLRGGRRLALATYQFPDGVPLCDLDNPRELLRRRLHPSDVVSGDRKRSQAWARRIYDERTFAGIRWWSRFDSQWFIVGLWRIDLLEMSAEAEELAIDDPRLECTARLIARRLANGR